MTDKKKHGVPPQLWCAWCGETCGSITPGGFCGPTCETEYHKDVAESNSAAAQAPAPESSTEPVTLTKKGTRSDRDRRLEVHQLIDGLMGRDT